MTRALHHIKNAYSAERLAVVVCVGVISGLVAEQFLPIGVSMLIGWDLGALVLLAWVWLVVGRFDASQTKSRATREDNNRVAIWIFLLSASIASLLGAGIALSSSSSLSPTDERALIATCLVSVFLSWGVVQTVFTLRYAHEYYSEPEGGITFGEDPDYQDFAYFAFTVGMTFQTSDSGVSSRRIRRTVLRHALLAYLFGAVILAVMVNVVASFVR
jgi:uncharacterized membrane protein